MTCTVQLKQLVRTLGLDKNQVMLDGEPAGYGAEHEIDVSPEQFLLQAERDFEAGGNTRRLNSLTNSKRAMLAQLDTLIARVGYDPRKMKTKEKWNLLRDIGFIAPRILRRISDSRNKLEHEYRVPSDGEVEDALDLASLFIESSHRGIGSFSLGNRSEYRDGRCDFRFRNELSLDFGLGRNGFLVWAFKDTPDAPHVDDRKQYKVGELLIGPTEPIYLDLLRIGVAVDRDIHERIEPTIRRFFDSLDRFAAAESCALVTGA
jgi:hypothetical protein